MITRSETVADDTDYIEEGYNEQTYGGRLRRRTEVLKRSRTSRAEEEGVGEHVYIRRGV